MRQAGRCALPPHSKARGRPGDARTGTARAWSLLLALLIGLIAPAALAQPVETNYFPEVISREFSVYVGGIQTPEYKDIVSRELSLFIGAEPDPPYRQVASREVSVVVTTPEWPAPVTNLTVTLTPTGETVTLSWAGYNQWAEHDVARYDIYMSTRPFTDVTTMSHYTVVPGETFSIALTNLTAWQDRFFAVVPVDALGGFDPAVNYAAAYVIAREVVSREFSVFVGAEPDPPYRQAVSREASIVVTTPEAPAPVTQLTVTPTPTGETVTLSWAGYNQWAEHDVARYAIYMSTRPFTGVTQMTNYTVVPGETFSITLTNLTAWQDHFFAVVPVDALSGFTPTVNYAAGYIVAREVVSREFSVFVGAEPDPPYRQAVSREVSIVVSTPEVPAQLTCLDCCLTPQGEPVQCLSTRDSVDAFCAIDLDWTRYNEVAQNDVARYRVYLGPTEYTNVCGLAPYAYVPAEARHYTITGLDRYGVYYVALVAEDVLGQINCQVRAQSAQASVDRVEKVRSLASTCGADWLTFTWLPPEGADPHTNNLLAGYRLYLGGGVTPVALDRFAVSYTASGLLPGHGYPVRITTVNNTNQESTGASLLTATLVPNPAETTVNTAYGGTRVSWERVQPEEVIQDFSVYIAETSFTSVAGMSPVLTTRGHWADFTDLIGGKTYWFAVTTRNIGGCQSVDLPVRVVSFAPTELQAPVIEDGALSFTVNGPLGTQYVLEASSDLREWVSLETYTPTAMPFEVTAPVTSAPGVSWFYRLLMQ